MNNRFNDIKVASILGIIGNMFLFIIKIIVAVLSQSQAMFADAFNSAGDIFSSAMTYVGNKIASRPSDEDHNLGHGKAEYIYSMLISIFMIMVFTIVLKNSIFSIFDSKNYEFSMWLIIVCSVTILIKFCLYKYANKLSKKHHNLLIEANSLDHRNDCILTAVNLLSAVLAMYKIYWFDGIAGMIISTWIIFQFYEIYKKSYDVLMDKSISIETKEKVFELIKKHDEVKKVIHFNSTPVGYKYQISFSIYVDGNMSTFDSHEIANKLEREIEKEIEEIYLTVIHVNPIVDDGK